MAHAHCTKHTLNRRKDMPGPIDPREADVNKIVRRAEVEKGTNSKVFWGNMQAQEGKQTQPKVWVTTHKVDYPARKGTVKDKSILKQRGAFMRTENISLGSLREPMVPTRMQKLAREHYVGRVKFRRGDKHEKTKSELYVCPAEIEEWKKKHLTTMSHRQFCGPQEADTAATHKGDRASIRQDMLASHFKVGGEEGVRGEAKKAQWMTQAQSDFQGMDAASRAAARQAVPEGIKSTDSCLNLMNAVAAVSSPRSFPDKLKAHIYNGRVPNRPATATANPTPPMSGDVKVSRATRHTRHSWKIGYDDDTADRDKYLSQQRIAFTPVNYSCSNMSAAATNRRDSMQQMIHTSSIPL